MMSDLPADLVEEILSRVPATSLKRLRSTCKGWNSLFKNPGFTEKHYRKASKQSMVLMVKDGSFFPMSVNLNVAAAPSIEFKSALSLKDSHSNSEVDICIVIHCDGLLLCTTTDERLVVWNPCLGETKWIQLKTNYMGNSDFAIGYQNNKSCRSYKILRCWNCENYVAFETYELSSDSWRILDNVALDCFIHLNTNVSLKGNTYLIADDREIKFLLSFDFTTERSKRLYLPPIQNYDRFMGLLVVREEQLSVLIKNYYTSKMEIWITNTIDSEAALSWTKSFTMELDTLRNFFCFSFLIDEEKKMAMCCFIRNVKPMKNMINITGVDNQYYREIPIEGVSTNGSYIFILNYVPNLVQI